MTGKILKFPVQASRLGHKRVRKRAKAADNPDQLQLFESHAAQLLDLPHESGPFEQALRFDERANSRAAEFYWKAIEAGDCVADAYCNLGILESNAGNTAKAFDCFTNSLKHDPRHAEAHFNLGNLYFEVNDFNLARIHYEIAAEIDRSFASVFFNLALLQAVNNDLPAAIITLTRYQQLVPQEEARKADELLRRWKTHQ